MRFSVQIVQLMLPFLRLPGDHPLRFLSSKRGENIISLKPKGKGD